MPLGDARKLENLLKRQKGGAGFYRITGLPQPGTDIKMVDAVHLATRLQAFYREINEIRRQRQEDSAAPGHPQQHVSAMV
jgi:hypothetical protein